jgi:hypothetical protein
LVSILCQISFTTGFLIVVLASTLVKNSVNAMKEHGVEEARIIFILCFTPIESNVNYF